MVDYEKLMDQLPPTSFAFAYGSGVFKQKGYGIESQLMATIPRESYASGPRNNAPSSAEKPMLDLIFAVDDPAAWHAENIQRNRHHYSGLGSILSPSSIATIQDETGAGLWYNTRVPIPSEALPAEECSVATSSPRLMKYGVVSTHSLLDDCLSWRNLYAAGRLQKPVRMLACTRPKLILSAARENLRHALRASLLLLPSVFTPRQLYTTIAALSYTGDWRMVFGENPHKVENIVSGNAEAFHELYSPLLAASFPHVMPHAYPDGLSAVLGAGPALGRGEREGAGEDLPMPVRYTQDVSEEARLALGMSLPLRLQRRMADAWHAESGRSITSSSSLFASPSLSSVDGGRPPMLPFKRSGRALNAAVTFAESGRDLFSRLRQVRLNALVSARERREERLQAGPEARGVRKLARASLRGGVEAGERSSSLQRGESSLKQLLLEGTDCGIDNFSKARGDSHICAFWDGILKASLGANALHSGHIEAPVVAGIISSSLVRAASAPSRDLRNDAVAMRASVYLRPALASIVGSSARTQSIKGILTAGPTKAALYSADKLKKYFKVVLRLR